mgnify:CR=1 FL=1
MTMDRFGDKVCCNPSVKLKKKESYPVIDIDRITPGYKHVRSVESIDYTGQGGAKFQDHDVLFARITPCLENGKMAIADTDGQYGIGSTELFVFRGIDGVSDTDYVYYLLCMKHIRQLAANSMTGASGRQRADLDFIKRIQWDFPDIEIQKKIASVLSAYDNLIEVNNKRIKVLEQMAENLYKEWFVRFHFPGYETAEFENGIPKGWAIRRVAEVGEVVGGGTPSTEHSEYWDGNIPWLTPADLTSFDDVYISSGGSFITVEGLKNSSAQLLPKNAVLLSSRAPIGYVAIAQNPLCTNQGFKSVVCDTDVLNPVYLFYYFKNNKALLECFASGSTFLELSGGRLKKIKLIVPPVSMQNSFEEIVVPWLKLTVSLSDKNKNLIKQRDLLLPRLMNGKLEV